MGIGNVLESEEIFGLVCGIEKAKAIRDCVEGPVNHLVSRLRTRTALARMNDGCSC